jgi:hypothetical protein
MPRRCLNHPDNVCYVCGEMTFKSQRRHFIPRTRECFELHFGCSFGDQDKRWAPHICCVPCVRLLREWVNGSRQMPFAVSMVWREPKDHSPNCYLRLTDITGITSKSKTHNEISRFPIYNEACPTK